MFDEEITRAREGNSAAGSSPLAEASRAPWKQKPEQGQGRRLGAECRAAW